MNFDDLLHRYFDTADLSQVSPAMLEAGIDRLRVDFGLESGTAGIGRNGMSSAAGPNAPRQRALPPPTDRKPF